MAALLLAATAPRAVALLAEPLLGTQAPIEADADRLEYDRVNGRLTAIGNAVVRQGGDELRADQIQMHTATGLALATGNVILTRPSGTLRTERLSYNFLTGIADLDAVSIDTAPFGVEAAAAERLSDNRHSMRDARITTCELEHPHTHYHVSASRIEVSPGEYFKAYDAVWHFGRVPVFYLPYWKRNLDSDRGFHLRPGYTSRWGAYLLGSYRQPISEGLRLEHQLDTRSKRGLAIGEHIRWTGDGQYGDLHLYFADDRAPETGNESLRSELDSERYRLRLRQQVTHRPDTYSLLQLDYAGDRFMREDFFEREFRRSPQPENYYVLMHHGDWYTLSGSARYRLNTFYNHVNRLPELTFDVMRLQLGDSSLYYQGRTSGAWLERTWDRVVDREDYSTIRLDSDHVIYQPRLLMGWLNVTPRAGYRGTYYTDSASTNRGATYRSVLSGGVESSYKAYLVLEEDGAGLRHMAEPYLNYTYVMEPTVLPEDLLQFDSIDTLRAAHVTRAGMRNKLQTRRAGGVFDLLDLNLFTDITMEPSRQERWIDHLFFELETRPAKGLRLWADGRYDLDQSTFDRVNSRLDIMRDPAFAMSLEHRYALNAGAQLSASLSVQPNPAWRFNVFGRYSFEAARAEEQGFYVQRNLDCMVVRTGMSMQPGFTRADGSQRDDEYRILVELWLTAFPEHAFAARSNYYAGDEP